MENDNVEIENKLKDLIDMAVIDNAIQSNQIEFDIADAKYRVKVPTIGDRKKINEVRVKKYMELLNTEGYYLEEDLREIYKKKGKDLDELDNRIRSLHQERKQKQVKLGELIKDEAPEKERSIYENEINSISSSLQNLAVKKANLLNYSIESQSNLEAFSTLCYLVVEIKDGDNWIKPWDSYEKFLEEKEEIVNVIAFYASLVATPNMDL